MIKSEAEGEASDLIKFYRLKEKISFPSYPKHKNGRVETERKVNDFHWTEATTPQFIFYHHNFKMRSNLKIFVFWNIYTQNRSAKQIITLSTIPLDTLSVAQNLRKKNLSPKPPISFDKNWNIEQKHLMLEIIYIFWKYYHERLDTKFELCYIICNKILQK